jgi:hypothetical protein
MTSRLQVVADHVSQDRLINRLLTIGREVVRHLRGKTFTLWLPITPNTNLCLFLGQAELHSLGFVGSVETIICTDQRLVSLINRVLAFVFYESGPVADYLGLLRKNFPSTSDA